MKEIRIHKFPPLVLNERSLERVSELKNAQWVGDFCIQGKSGWTESPVAVFYQETPPNGYSPYFGIFFGADGKSYITNGSSFCPPDGIAGLLDPESGVVIYSRFRHDYQPHPTNPDAFIDGGRDYVRTSGSGIPVTLKAEKAELVVAQQVWVNETTN